MSSRPASGAAPVGSCCAPWRRSCGPSGSPALRIGVLTSNLPAREFYEAMGGREVEQRTFDEDGLLLPETVYAWPDLMTLLPPER